MEKINQVDGVKRLEFKYDFMGRRYQKDVYVYSSGSFPSSADITTSFIYDGWNPIQEKITDNNISTTDTRSYVWGLDLSQTLQGAGGVGGLLCTIHKPQGGSATAYYAMADANGNITDYVDDAGALSAHFEYDAFGKVTDETAASGLDADDFPVRFSSKYQDEQTDLNYYGFRYYSAGIGRWLNRDPIEEGGGVNIYAFIQNRTISYIDILGLAEMKTDDFQRKCCESDMTTVSLIYDPYVSNEDNGHACIQTPNQTVGFYPKTPYGGAGSYVYGDTRAGRLADDRSFAEGKQPGHPGTDLKKKDKKACPDSVKKVDSWINKQKKGRFDKKLKTFDPVDYQLTAARGRTFWHTSRQYMAAGPGGVNQENCWQWACRGFSDNGSLTISSSDWKPGSLK